MLQNVHRDRMEAVKAHRKENLSVHVNPHSKSVMKVLIPEESLLTEEAIHLDHANLLTASQAKGANALANVSRNSINLTGNVRRALAQADRLEISVAYLAGAKAADTNPADALRMAIKEIHHHRVHAKLHIANRILKVKEALRNLTSLSKNEAMSHLTPGGQDAAQVQLSVASARAIKVQVRKADQ